jgi:hypothetical protein
MSDEAGYSAIAVVVSALAGIVVAIGSVLAVSMLWSGSGVTLWEQLFRVGPTVQGGGIGADWTSGNTIPALDFLIAITHAADVLLGVFILVLVFLHWASFRRLAGMMRGPSSGERAEGVATDGGNPSTTDESASPKTDGGESHR